MPTDRKSAASVAIIDPLKDRILKGWLHGFPEQQLAQMYGLSRAQVEEVLREKVAKQLRPPASPRKEALLAIAREALDSSDPERAWDMAAAITVYSLSTVPEQEFEPRLGELRRRIGLEDPDNADLVHDLEHGPVLV